MIGRLRELADRPIPENERRWLFALTVALLALAAAALLALGRAPDPQAPTARPLPAPTAPPISPVERAATAPPRAVGAARRFLAGYLRFLYGHAGAREIESVTPQLRRRLSASRLRVPPAARQRRPRVVRLKVQSLAAEEVVVRAEVEDGGVARYPVAVRLRRSGGGWRAVAVGTD